MINRLRNEKLYKVKEVADILQIGRESIYDFIDDGRIKAFKFGGSVWRIAESDLNEFIFNAKQYKVVEGKK